MAAAENAARALLRWEQKDLAQHSGISLPSIKRLETKPGPLAAYGATVEAIVGAFERAGVEFAPELGVELSEMERVVLEELVEVVGVDEILQDVGIGYAEVARAQNAQHHRHPAIGMVERL